MSSIIRRMEKNILKKKGFHKDTVPFYDVVDGVEFSGVRKGVFDSTGEYWGEHYPTIRDIKAKGVA